MVTGDAVLLGRLSFKMIKDKFDMSGFELVPNETSSPNTGVKIDVDLTHSYESTKKENCVFRFDDATASKDANLLNIVVSSGEKNDDPEQNTYKKYDLKPEFNNDLDEQKYIVTLYDYLDTIDITAELSDKDKAKMKIRIPKHDSDGNLVYDDSEGTTIIYEEYDLTNEVPYGVTLNKLGDPDTIITIIVTAEDGVTTREYEVTIKRPYATIRGKAILADFDNPIVAQNFLDTYGTILNHKVQISLYKADLARWEEISDIYHTTYENPFNYEDLAKIPKETTMKSKEDGTFEIYIIPGKYDLQIERPSFLDYIYSDIELEEGDNIDMGEIRLTAGDTNRDGVITVEDINLTKKVMDMEKDDPSFKEDYNPTQTGTVMVEDLKYVKINIDEEIQIVYFK